MRGEILIDQLNFVFVLFLVSLGFGHLHENWKIFSFCDSVAFRIDLKSPLNTIQKERIGINNTSAAWGKVTKTVLKVIVFRQELLDGLEGLLYFKWLRRFTYLDRERCQYLIRVVYQLVSGFSLYFLANSVSIELIEFDFLVVLLLDLLKINGFRGNLLLKFLN